MAALLTALTTTIDVLTGADALAPHQWDTLMTFGVAGILILLGAAVIALLPWTDQQIAATDAEARLVARRVAVAVAARSRSVPVVVPRSS